MNYIAWILFVCVLALQLIGVSIIWYDRGYHIGLKVVDCVASIENQEIAEKHNIDVKKYCMNLEVFGD